MAAVAAAMQDLVTRQIALPRPRRRAKKGQIPVPTDLTDHWAKPAVLRLMEKGILTGYGDGTFRPNNSMTRGEFSIVIVKAMGLTPAEGNTAFTDLDGVWAAPYIKAANEAGYVNGVGGGRFAPDASITRQEAVTVLSRALELKKSDPAPFGDLAQVDAWALEAVNAAYAAGVIKGGSDGAFHPRAPLTRAEMAAMVDQLPER